MEIVNTIKDTLSDREHRTIDNPDSIYFHAAVLMPLFIEDDVYKILFTKRTNKVENHKGQISFPGGATDEGDRSLKETALRESYEEVGLLAKDVEILGRIDDALTVVSNYLIHPFVGLIPYPYNFRINTDEVERLISVPLEIFLKQNPDGETGATEVDYPPGQEPVYNYKGDIIWGATARIMANFIRIIGDKIT